MTKDFVPNFSVNGSRTGGNPKEDRSITKERRKVAFEDKGEISGRVHTDRITSKGICGTCGRQEKDVKVTGSEYEVHDDN